MIATAHSTLKSGIFLSYSRYVISKWTKPSNKKITPLCFSWDVNCYFSLKYIFPERVVFFSYVRALRSSKIRARFAISSSKVLYRLQINLTSPNKNRSVAISNSKFDVPSHRSLQALKFVIPEFLNWVPFCGKKLLFYTVIQCNRNSKNNNKGATLSLKGHGYYSEATRDNIKEADCAERDTGAEQLCAKYFVVWFGFRWLLEKAALPTVTAQHVTHTYNSTYGARNKQNTDDMERIKCDSNGKTTKGCNFTTNREGSYCTTGFNGMKTRKSFFMSKHTLSHRSQLKLFLRMEWNT